MNRETIFRGKRVDDDEWVYGWLFKQGDNFGIQVLVDIAWEVKPETIGQYTNITDKNEQMIFEGDIISDSNGSIYTVEFNKDRGGWFPFAQGDGCGCCEHEVVYDYSAEIIGNKIDGKIKEPTKPESIHLTGDNLKQWVSFKAEKDRVEGIPLEEKYNGVFR